MYFISQILKIVTMRLVINNKAVESGAENLTQLSLELNLPATGIAVAVNQRMIPRSEWNSFILSEGMDIIIIKAVCGG